jgi:hypothetical protein
VTNESPKTQQTGGSWSGRFAAILIVVVIGVAMILVFFAARGPR